MAYASRTDVEAFFAAADLAVWADRDNDQSLVKIAANIASALTSATDDIDDHLRGGPYTIPFTTVPTMIVDLCRKLAGCLLYSSRGAQDTNEATGEAMDRLAPIRREVYRKLGNIRAGNIRMNVASICTDSPFVVSSDTE